MPRSPHKKDKDGTRPSRRPGRRIRDLTHAGAACRPPAEASGATLPARPSIAAGGAGSGVVIPRTHTVTTAAAGPAG